MCGGGVVGVSQEPVLHPSHIGRLLGLLKPQSACYPRCLMHHGDFSVYRGFSAGQAMGHTTFFETPEDGRVIVESRAGHSLMNLNLLGTLFV